MVGDSPIAKCSFCGKGQKEAKKLIGGPGVFICDECIELCNEILEDEIAEAAEKSSTYEPVPDEASSWIFGGNSPFTSRERSILLLMGQGISPERTAEMLGVAHGTLRRLLANIRTKVQRIEESGGHDEHA